MGTIIGLGAGFIAFGLLAMAAGGVTILLAQREAASRLSAWGEVIALRGVPAVYGFIQCPVVRFQAETGEWMTIESSVGGQPPLHAVGQRVEVFYPRGKPGEGELQLPTVLWLVPAGIFAVGFALAGFGTVMLLVGLVTASG